MTNARHWSHIVLSALTLCLAVAAIMYINIQPKPVGSQEIKTALIQYTDTAVTPDDSGWIKKTLPDDWFREGDAKPFKWYKIQFPVEENLQESLGIYITNASRPVLAFVDGKLVNAYDTVSGAMPRVWIYPQFIPVNLESPRPKVIDILLRIEGNQSVSGLLGQIYIGSVADVKKEYDTAFFVKARVPWLTLWAMFLSGVLTVAFWMLRRKDSIYGLYTLGAFTWVMYSFQYVPSSLPISDYLWELIGMNSMFWFPIIVAFFCNNYLKAPQPKAELFVLVSGIVLSLSTLLVDRVTFYWMADYILPPSAFILGIYPMGRMLIETLRRRDSRLTWLTILAGSLTYLLLGNDALVLGHWIPSWSGLYFYYAALPLITIVLSILLLERLVDTLNEAEQLNVSLEKRVQEKADELENNYSRLRKLEQEQYLADERERIMRDMHDGIGGALLSMRASLERDEWNRKDIHTGVCEALDDLYLMVHSLDPYDEDLGMALGATRHRFERRLTQAGLTLGWHLGDIPPVKGLGPKIVLQVIRIIQEAINNVIKHASASQVIIQVSSVTFLDEDLPTTRIEIVDDGRGISYGETTGFGMKNMKQRADNINANLSIKSDNKGIIVRLDLPPK